MRRAPSLNTTSASVAVLLAVALLLGPTTWVVADDSVDGPIVKQADQHAGHGLAVAGQQLEDIGVHAADDVAGPVVKLPDQLLSERDQDEEDAGVVTVAEQVAEQVHETAQAVAQAVDKALVQEFGNGTAEAEGKVYEAAVAKANAAAAAAAAANATAAAAAAAAVAGDEGDEGLTAAETESAAASAATAAAAAADTKVEVSTETNTVETVVRISSGSAAGGGGAGGGEGASGEKAAQGTPKAGAPASEGGMDASLDRIIDSHDNEFVLSKKGGATALTIDPQLVTDLTVVIAAAAFFGLLFEAMGQPTINGYLVAGAAVGPGGLGLVKELVQVESVAQLGVFMLLFGLGMELSVTRVRSVLGVSIVGGSLQIFLAMLIGGVVSVYMCDSEAAPGLFVGALLSMSSTSVVVKCLEATRSMRSWYGTICVGTLILQDCWVGLLFALLPLFKPHGPHHDAASARPGAGAAHEAAHAIAEAESSGELTAQALFAVAKVLFRIATIGGMSLLFARVAGAPALSALVRRGSRELAQLLMVGFCLLATWGGAASGISRELGAFLGGLMVSAAAGGAVAAAPSLTPGWGAGGGDHHSGEREKAPSGKGVNANGCLEAGGAGGAAWASIKAGGGGGDADDVLEPLAGSGGSGGVGGGGGIGGGGGGGAHTSATEALQHALRHNIESFLNVTVALFLTSTALIISPVFLWQHVRTLAVGTIVVMAAKSALVAGTVSWFGHSWRASLAIGLTMGHVGEFAFVLLSTSTQMGILPPQVSL
ncbi:hypothetical protein FOA52_012388 [Chlamydomonas sp. UWO 241]|nr:hypothetical protein FOA52_012388 [Chlamydomonas sp. UWO 241]